MPKRNELEQRTIEFIVMKGEAGILQSVLWKKLNVTSREGSRISLKLETNNQITRVKELSNGRWTYRIFPKKNPINIDQILNVPCTTCPDLLKCDARGEVSPSSCNVLGKWLSEIAKKMSD